MFFLQNLWLLLGNVSSLKPTPRKTTKFSNPLQKGGAMLTLTNTFDPFSTSHVSYPYLYSPSKISPLPLSSHHVRLPPPWQPPRHIAFLFVVDVDRFSPSGESLDTSGPLICHGKKLVAAEIRKGIYCLRNIFVCEILRSRALC